MKLTNNRFYLDFNATSPLADSVKEYLARGEFFFANPASVHAEGKAAKRALIDTSEYLYQLFRLKESEFILVYHSGATEAINSVIKGFALKGSIKHFFHFGTDHSSVRSQKEHLDALGVKVHVLPVNQDGSFDKQKIIELIKKEDGPKLINFTWLNNETGVIHDLKTMAEIKAVTGAYVHVDAVQSIGKMSDWKNLDSTLDIYTYSGHKFGSLKNVGMSFIRHNLPISALIRGGGQQHGLRSGTENAMGITTLFLALIELNEKFNPTELSKAKNEFESRLVNLIGDKGEVVGFKNQFRSLNTINFLLYETKSQVVSTALDLGGIDVSTGSACSSGAVKPSPVLMSMGYTEEHSKSAIRVSFSYQFNMDEIEETWTAFSKVLSRFI
ncbi:MAG: cysteine desulfurase NifS [Bdellovibrio sp.]